MRLFLYAVLIVPGAAGSVPSLCQTRLSLRQKKPRVSRQPKGHYAPQPTHGATKSPAPSPCTVEGGEGCDRGIGLRFYRKDGLCVHGAAAGGTAGTTTFTPYNAKKSCCKAGGASGSLPRRPLGRERARHPPGGEARGWFGGVPGAGGGNGAPEHTARLREASSFRTGRWGLVSSANFPRCPSLRGGMGGPWAKGGAAVFGADVLGFRVSVLEQANTT